MASSPPTVATPTLATTDASEPFNRPDANVYLLSSDNVKFYCHKVNLALASPFFSDMFSLPPLPPHTPPDEGGSQSSPETIDGRPVVPMTESSTTVDALLRLVYPVERPTRATLLEYTELLRVGRKYLFTDVVLRPLTQAFHALSESSPLQAFGIACRFDMEEEAMQAAKHAVKLKEDRGKAAAKVEGEYAAEMEGVSAGMYFRLQWFLRNDGDVPDAFRFITRSVDDGTTELPAKKASSSSEEKLVSEAGSSPATVEEAEDGVPVVSDGLFDRIPADVEIHSISDPSARINAHKSVLAMASPLLADKLSTLPDAKDGLPVLTLHEDAKTLRVLLQFCYGILTSLEHPTTTDLDATLFFQVVTAAQKYGMTRVEDAAKLVLRPYLSTDPLAAYFVAVSVSSSSSSSSSDWQTEIRTAARHAVDVPDVDRLYVDQMEVSPAKSYYNLLQYRSKCIDAVSEIKDQYASTEPVANDTGLRTFENIRTQAEVSVLRRIALLAKRFRHDAYTPGGNTMLSTTLVVREFGKLDEDTTDWDDTLEDLKEESLMMELKIRENLVNIVLHLD
ncbi:hypothetical protein EIP91_004349 [Steccherinum ochraceum]|uniref:BTB domain-containing protein n=1 Tax=Steccherinum ochraceum TaxID=92696 RepID=A0A4R0RP98_9APHY|nr:hypothetical protein EIP91_004349 [Steccherinum ochraceum]